MWLLYALTSTLVKMHEVNERWYFCVATLNKIDKLWIKMMTDGRVFSLHYANYLPLRAHHFLKLITLYLDP